MFNWVKRNPTLIYSFAVTALPVVAYFVEFDQEIALTALASLLTLVTGVAVRKANLNATAEAKQEVPDGYVSQSELFPAPDTLFPIHDMSVIQRYENKEV